MVHSGLKRSILGHLGPSTVLWPFLTHSVPRVEVPDESLWWSERVLAGGAREAGLDVLEQRQPPKTRALEFLQVRLLASDFLFPLQPQPPPHPSRQAPRPSHPRELDFGPFRVRFGPFRVCSGPFRGVGWGRRKGLLFGGGKKPINRKHINIFLTTLAGQSSQGRTPTRPRDKQDKMEISLWN